MKTSNNKENCMKNVVNTFAMILIAASLVAQTCIVYKSNKQSEIIKRYEATLQQIDKNAKRLIKDLADLKNPKVDEIITNLSKVK